jgi:hypothetical protein
MPGRRQIEDREAAMDKRHATVFVHPNAVIVGAAVLQTRVHCRRYFGKLAPNSIRSAGYKSSDAAHQQCSLLEG